MRRHGCQPHVASSEQSTPESHSAGSMRSPLSCHPVGAMPYWCQSWMMSRTRSGSIGSIGCISSLLLPLHVASCPRKEPYSLKPFTVVQRSTETAAQRPKSVPEGAATARYTITRGHGQGGPIPCRSNSNDQGVGTRPFSPDPPWGWCWRRRHGGCEAAGFVMWRGRRFGRPFHWVLRSCRCEGAGGSGCQRRAVHGRGE